MQITKHTSLTPAQTAEVFTLIKTVHDYDYTAKDIVLSNAFNCDKTMPAIYLADVAATVVGLLAIYADEKPDNAAEIALYVHPEFRRQGIATTLWQAAIPELRKSGYSNVTWKTERNFMNQNPDFFTAFNLDADPVTEFQLQAASTAGHLNSQINEQLVELTATDTTELVDALGVAFAEEHASLEASRAVARQYITAGLADANTISYLYKVNGRLAAYCAIDQTPVAGAPYHYLYGVFVVPELQGQGVATRFLQTLIATLGAVSTRTFKLAVESDNPAAQHLYAKVGFEPETEMIYVTGPENSRWQL